MTPEIPPVFGLERAQAEAFLEEHHQFPCSYMFKVIGFNQGDFQGAIQRAAEGVLGLLDPLEDIRCRPSSGGKYLSVTLDVEVDGAGAILDVYRALREVQGVVVLV